MSSGPSFDSYRPSDNMSSSTTPLLPRHKNNNQKDEHPLFLRVCHSPWSALNQQNLMVVRGLLAAYMIAAFCVIADWEFKHNNHGAGIFFFEASNISFFIQTVYATIAFVWTYMHLYYPHHLSEDEHSLAAHAQRFFSPPKQNPDTKNRYFFSMFQTCALVYPHVVTMVYWLIIVPHRDYKNPGHALFGHGDQKSFVIVNLFGLNSMISLIENFFLSSVKRQHPIAAHNFGLTTVSAAYIGWIYYGKYLTGHYVYWFLDPAIVDDQNIAANALSFAALANVFFAFTYGITGFRENLTKREHHGSNSRQQEQQSGYQRQQQ